MENMNNQIKFIIGGEVITINKLDKLIDEGFISLHSAYFTNSTISWNDFEEKVITFFNSRDDISSQDNYFSNFTVIWNKFLSKGNFDKAEHIWQMALAPVLTWEKSTGRRIHKGTAYYFWGVTALLRGDLDKGYTLMHQAIEEDVLISGQQAAVDKPAYALVSLNFSKVDQYFLDWVRMQMHFLNELQNKYSVLYSRPFILEDFKNKFLSSSTNIQAVFLLAYSVARLMNLSRLPKHVLQSRFAGQLELNILFDLTLVIDAVIKEKHPDKWRFIDHAEFLSKKMECFLSKDELSEVNCAFEKDGDAITQKLLDENFILSNGKKLISQQTDIVLSYVLRNHAAHDVVSLPTLWKRYEEVQQKLMNVLFASVDYL